MTKCMWMHVRRQTLRNRNFLDDAANAARSKPPAAKVDQQCDRLLTSLLDNLFALRKIPRERSLHRFSKRNVAFFLPLAANQDCFRTQPDIVDVDPDAFSIANAAPIEQLHHQ